MGLSHQPVILMRPGAANDRLAAKLKADGIEAWCWPAFTITLPEDQELVAQRLAHLDDVDMVVLASPAAVAAVAHWVQEWPEHITLATVGEGTARVIRAAWGDDVPVIFPKGDAEQSGSEALFDLLKHTQIPRRVLIARGQTGREWLAEQLTQLGADVEKLAAYVRVPIELTTQQIEDLRLNGYVKRRCRLVGNQKLWPADHGHGDHHTLTHTTGKLMWIFSISLFMRRDSYFCKHFNAADLRLIFVTAVMDDKCLIQLFSNGLYRV